ncbi:8-oxo-dGTP diphosphatase [Helcococcus sueciensis]|uniref:8-oxo-dGTP diphosphatase n=1 Tax=Helcococcus sueciensis TaxID=241555 RepID=UPI00042589D3|nr:NUDIX domain-containing protein [Helcococcus sueciensis]
MKTVLYNMIRIMDGENVVVLDKNIKEGWEGLTFPGGKLEPNESIYESTIREAKEETNLDVKNLQFNGIIHWIEEDVRLTGFLYTTEEFSGELVEENVEGRLFFNNYEKLKKMPNLSDSMNYIFDIYDGKYFEIVLFYENGKRIDEKSLFLKNFS